MYHKGLSGLAVAAFLLQVLLPFFASYQGQAGDASPLFGDRILLCSPDGFQWIDRGDLDGQPEHDARYQCPLCYVSVHASGIAPSSASQPLAPLHVAELISGRHWKTDIQPAQEHWHQLRPRAPPAHSFNA